MEMVSSPASSLSHVANPWKEFMLDWSVIFLVLLSMIIQIVLVFGGAIRHSCGSRWLNFMVWGCYMGADFVATSALGAMINYSSGARVYAIWACVVIVHLGGPDTITAYSVSDSNLWRRHCFNVSYQGSVASYVVYVSAVQGREETEWHLLGAAALIFIVGISKYSERALALRLASPSQIVSSVQPVHNYMKTEHALGLLMDETISDDEIADVDVFGLEHEYKVDENNVHYQYIVAREKCFHEYDGNAGWSESIITIKDVWEDEGQVVTDNYLLCVSHALFKMYKRRFASLRFHEATLYKMRIFFGEWRFSENQVFNILEIELKFLYDYLFSKSSGTAFSAWGVVMRVVNISLLGFCWYFIVRGVQETEDVVHGQRIVTYILMCVAVGLEVFQLGRIILSDWSMVWLVCESIRQSRKLSDRWWCTCTAKLIGGVASMVGRARKAVRGKYWKNQLPQLCVLKTCFRAGNYSCPLIRKVIKRGYVGEFTAWHIETQFLDEDSKNRVVNHITLSSTSPSVMFQYMRRVFKHVRNEGESVGWEHMILAWHVGTTICERLQDQSEKQYEGVKRDIDFAVGMSRYFAYLLVTCPELLPVDPENAKRVYSGVFSEIMGKMGEKEDGTVDDFCKNFIKDSSDTISGATTSIVFRLAKREITKRREEPLERRWKSWAENWLIMLQLCGMYDKLEVHGGRVTAGGEFATLVWVLMGHMGQAESYKATALKVDPFLYEDVIN